MPCLTERITYSDPPHTRYQSCPEDWWKGGDTITYSDDAPNGLQDTVERDLHPSGAIDKSVSPELEYVFKNLVERWSKETGAAAITLKRYSHPAYKSLLMLGSFEREKITALILNELRQRPDHWFDALRKISKTNPAHDAKTPDEATKAWIDWGRLERIIS